MPSFRSQILVGLTVLQEGFHQSTMKDIVQWYTEDSLVQTFVKVWCSFLTVQSSAALWSLAPPCRWPIRMGLREGLLCQTTKTCTNSSCFFILFSISCVHEMDCKPQTVTQHLLSYKLTFWVECPRPNEVACFVDVYFIGNFLLLPFFFSSFFFMCSVWMHRHGRVWPRLIKLSAVVLSSCFLHCFMEATPVQPDRLAHTFV